MSKFSKPEQYWDQYQSEYHQEPVNSVRKEPSQTNDKITTFYT